MEVSNYELLVVGRVIGETDSLLSKLEKIVKDNNVSGLAASSLGKKTLAYPIAKQTEAEYFLFNFQAPGEVLKSITDSLRLEQESVLRYLLIKTKEAKPSKKERATKTAKLEEQPTVVAAEPKATKKTAKRVAKSAKVEKKGTKKKAK